MISNFFKIIVLSFIALSLIGCPPKKKPQNLHDGQYKKWENYDVSDSEQQSRLSYIFEKQVFTIYFTVNEDNIDEKGIIEIDRAVDELMTKHDACIEIIGWADNVMGQSQNYKYNQNLAFNRVQWIREELVARGVNPDVIKKVTGLVKELPQNSTKQERDEWRKAEIFVLPCLHAEKLEGEVDPQDPFKFR